MRGVGVKDEYMVVGHGVWPSTDADGGGDGGVGGGGGGDGGMGGDAELMAAILESDDTKRFGGGGVRGMVSFVVLLSCSLEGTRPPDKATSGREETASDEFFVFSSGVKLEENENGGEEGGR